MTGTFRPINITLGSNKFIETNGIISVKGKELFKMELAGDMRPLITVEIRNQKDELLGKVWKSTSFVHSHQDYEPIYERENNTVKRLALRRKSDHEDVFEIIFHAPNDVEINGIFFVKGLNFPIIATREFLDLNTNKFIQNVKYKGNTGITIDSDFMAI
jgi:hypothetical protein